MEPAEYKVYLLYDLRQDKSVSMIQSTPDFIMKLGIHKREKNFDPYFTSYTTFIGELIT